MVRRLYLDTNVFVDALEEPASPQGRLLQAATDGEFEVVLSEVLIEELRYLIRRLHGRSAGFEAAMMLVELPVRRFIPEIDWKRGVSAGEPFVRDRADTPHLASALVARSDAFVTRNRRSVSAGIFDLVALASGDTAWEAVSGARPWPTREEMRQEWERWARRSSRAPKLR